MKKHGVLALVLAGVMLLLCGCGGMTTDDAMDYVQSALDCGYKAEVKKYAEITETTEKEAKKEYETNLDTIMKEAGFDDTGVSDELKADYRSMFEKMLKSANYKVKEAKETEDDEFIPLFAENMDIKICNYCDMGCKFCHEGSTINGKFGNILNEKFAILREMLNNKTYDVSDTSCKVTVTYFVHQSS